MSTNIQQPRGIKVNALVKSFTNVEVLRGVTFEVKRGTITALLGPNGAGKTTIINILSTLLKPDKGTASVAGHDISSAAASVRASIGLTGQFAAVDEYLSARENLEMIARLYHMKDGIKDKAQELLERFDLTETKNRQVRTFSGGMKRRLDLAMSLISSPPVLFLDEPTTGLDPRSRQALWVMIKQLAQEGRTILLTTQYMDEAEHLADNIVVIDSGKVIAAGTPAQLKSKVGAERVEVSVYNEGDIVKVAALFEPSLTTVDEDNRTVRVTAKNGASSLRDAVEKVESTKVKVSGFSLRQPTLDDVFLNLTGHDALHNQDKANHNEK